MKKVVKSLCIITATFASLAVSTESHAIPAFARQIGMACNACHFQSFPALNSFGRAFKATGYTMIGSQAKIEDEMLSIPATLNMAVLAATTFTKASGNNTPTMTTSLFPSDFSLFVAGRVSENVGALGELGLIAPGPLGSVANFKLPLSWDVGAARVSVVPFVTDGQGPSYSFETLNAGASAIHTVMVDAPVYSAAQYLVTNTPAHGLGFVATSDMGYVNFTKWAPTNLSNANNGGVALAATYLRLVATPNLMKDWDTAIGLQVFSGGGNSNVIALGPPAPVQTKAWVLDAQFQGAAAGMPLGVYASYGVAKANSCDAAGVLAVGTAVNLYNAGCVDNKSFNIGAKLEAIPHRLMLMIGYRNAKVADTVAFTGSAFNTLKDNGWTLGADYKLAQNVKLRAAWSQYSGSLYDANRGDGVTVGLGLPTNMTTLALEAAF